LSTKIVQLEPRRVDLDTRELLQKTGPLEEPEKQELMREFYENALHAPVTYEVRVMFALIHAINELDRTSTRLSRRMILLTWLILVLTFVSAGAGIMQIYDLAK
jgi:hypothetical protein